MIRKAIRISGWVFIGGVMGMFAETMTGSDVVAIIVASVCFYSLYRED